jgi:hypothetical protein
LPILLPCPNQGEWYGQGMGEKGMHTEFEKIQFGSPVLMLEENNKINIK